MPLVGGIIIPPMGGIILPPMGGIIIPPMGGIIIPPIGGIIIPPIGGIIIPPIGGIIIPPIGGIIIPPIGGIIIPPMGGAAAEGMDPIGEGGTVAWELLSRRLDVSAFGSTLTDREELLPLLRDAWGVFPGLALPRRALAMGASARPRLGPERLGDLTGEGDLAAIAAARAPMDAAERADICIDDCIIWACWAICICCICIAAKNDACISLR
jgi:hypothetical protein